MPRPSKRTRTRRRQTMALPGGNRALAYKREPVALSRCSSCGRPLAGFSRLSLAKPRRLSRTGRRVWRVQGGQLCHECVKKHLKLATRGL